MNKTGQELSWRPNAVYTVAHKKQPLRLFVISLSNLHQSSQKMQQQLMHFKAVLNSFRYVLNILCKS